MTFIRFGELSAILQCRLEENPGIELSSVVVKCQAVGSTALSMALTRATAKDRVLSPLPCRQAMQVRT